ncbi:hypothetical protein BT96DRAFT_932273 [Gymnopus androsaceus JB14]|uniref:Acyl-CoA thioesterase-like N-terminal HotDog domain-containing protein n=1 Tax=Gymnopus androsaceus JB14 TaxID=1447944 RepID=A0A6A4IEI5_9AGAR|nr:hypothetical protein BT96DRAFT_932273 [Gymnopus androsaceus JB14]
MLFHEAIKVAPISSHNDVSIYAGEMDGEWCVDSVPNGGYVLAQIIEACVQQQSQCPHLDPIHVTAHFLNAASLSPFEVHIRCLKRGKRFTNLVAELLQDKIVKVISHLIFGVLESPLTEGCGSENAINLLPPSPYARRVPLHHHPAQAPTTGLDRRYKFHSSPRRATSSDTIGGGGVDYGLWCGFKDKDEAVTISSLPFFADISLNAPTSSSWFPTMTMNIEYKFTIPKTSKAHSNRTVGIFSSTNFINGRLGRHDMYTEIWTAPSDIRSGAEAVEGWRNEQVCLAVSTQMALTVPIAMNLAKGKL